MSVIVIDTPQHCPGSLTIPPVLVSRGSRPRGICQYCQREYAVDRAGTLRRHKALPVDPGGGCPYRCPGPECDFACYHKAVK